MPLQVVVVPPSRPRQSRRCRPALLVEVAPPSRPRQPRNMKRSLLDVVSAPLISRLLPSTGSCPLLVSPPTSVTNASRGWGPLQFGTPPYSKVLSAKRLRPLLVAPPATATKSGTRWRPLLFFVQKGRRFPQPRQVLSRRDCRPGTAARPVACWMLRSYGVCLLALPAESSKSTALLDFRQSPRSLLKFGRPLVQPRRMTDEGPQRRACRPRAPTAPTAERVVSAGVLRPAIPGANGSKPSTALILAYLPRGRPAGRRQSPGMLLLPCCIASRRPPSTAVHHSAQVQ